MDCIEIPEEYIYDPITGLMKNTILWLFIKITILCFTEEYDPVACIPAAELFLHTVAWILNNNPCTLIWKPSY